MFNPIWYLHEIKQDKPVKVFTIFSCGGGSSMGYKRAGFEVIGNCEIDPRMNSVYLANNHPKYNFNMDAREFLQKEDLPAELYNLDILDGSPPCFKAGTKVKTSDGYKNIENVVVGDMVLTHNNRYRKVTNVMCKQVETYYKVKIQGSVPLSVTENHPFYVRTMQRVGETRTWGNPEWVQVHDLCQSKHKGTVVRQSYVGIPINQQSKIPQWDGVEHTHNIYGKASVIKKKHELDLTSKAVWRMIGRYIGDGWLRYDHKEVVICVGKHQKDDLLKIIADAGYRCTVSEECTTYKATIHNVELFTYLQQFGSTPANKKLTSDVLDLPTDLLEEFIDGYLSADGHRDGDIYSCCSVSEELILGLQQCIAKVYNQPTNIAIKINDKPIEGCEVHCHTAWNLSFRKKWSQKQHFICDDGYLWVPFREKELVSEQIIVYNLTVEDDESYTVHNMAVHNCSTFSMSGDREKAWGKEKVFREGQKAQTLDDLFFVFLDVVEKLKPRCVIAENVVGMLAKNARGYVNLIIKRFKELGYEVQLFRLNAAFMEVPQKRQRVFFIANRMGYGKLELKFNYKPITFGEIRDKEPGEKVNPESKSWSLLALAKTTDRNLADVGKRLGKKASMFNQSIVWDNDVVQTLTAGTLPYRGCDRTYFTIKDIKTIQTFPQDYNFVKNSTNNANYICGMSVPPNMMAHIATEVWKQWLSKDKEIIGRIKEE